MSIHRVWLPLLVAVVCSGCVEIRETIKLNMDGSGTAHMTVIFPQLGMRWLPGKPTADWIRPNLPEGVRLTSFKNAQSKIKFTGPDGKQQDLVGEVFDIDFSFDKITALNNVRVRPDRRNAKAALVGATPGKAGAPALAMMAQERQGPKIGPFQKLTLTRDGKLLRFSRIVQAARDPKEMEAAMNRPGSATKPAVYDLRDSKLVISIECPGQVVEHNAHQVKGRNLTWTFKLQELQEHQDRDWIVKFTCREDD
jgi:hypothetical protein